jgi:hypothetical protein
MKLRCLSDIRQLPLLVGALQAIWATIPALEIEGSLFSELLQYLSLDREWGWTMMLSGLYLCVGAIIKRRDTLTIGLFIAATLWTTLAVIFADALWYTNASRFVTPITLSMPLFAISLWFALYREMIFKPVSISERRKMERAT